DAFDAMVTTRPYRGSCALGDARAELERCSGTQFDPNIVEAFRHVVGVKPSMRAPAMVAATTGG
ncbi:MAG: hypothetical protein AVDCRST_MAG89-3067, partial [uncultured Gemmatimonadetes bacterium]